jgi:hypothetical protein
MNDFASELKEQYQHLHEYLSTVTWMHYEEAKKRGKDHKGYVYFFGRTLHRLLHPFYFFHQKDDPEFHHERNKFDPKNPEENFSSWPEKKAFLTTKFREKKLEIYSREFTQKVFNSYEPQVILWLIQNHQYKILEFDPHLSFYFDILHWSEEHFQQFLEESQEFMGEFNLQPNKLSSVSASV